MRRDRAAATRPRKRVPHPGERDKAFEPAQLTLKKWKRVRRRDRLGISCSPRSSASADTGCSTLCADTPLEVRLERGERDAESLDSLIHRLAGSEVLQELADTRRPDPVEERARRKGTFLVGDHRL